MFKVGIWNGLVIISENEVTLENLISESDNYIICLNQRIHANRENALLPSDTVDIVFSKYFNMKLNEYYIIIGYWNDIPVLSHVDDIQLLECTSFNMECQLLPQSIDTFIAKN